MNRQDHDIELKEALQNDIKIPEIVDGRMEEMYDKIRSGEVRMKQLKGGSSSMHGHCTVGRILCKPGAGKGYPAIGRCIRPPAEDAGG